MKRIITLVTIDVGMPGEEKMVPPFSILSVDNNTYADDLIHRKFAREMTEFDAQFYAQAIPSNSMPELTPDQPPLVSSVDRESFIDSLVDAIADLPDADFGSDKKPKVAALKNILQTDVAAVDRDEAWAIYQSLSDT